MLNGLSLFSSAGIAEMNLSSYCNIVLANEILPIRARAHAFWHPNAEMICGDITDSIIKDKIVHQSLKKNINLILVTPPCQGVSLIGKNKRNAQWLKDERNYLIFHALEIIDRISPDVIVIENVDRFAKVLFPFENTMINIETILSHKYGKDYQIKSKIYNSADYGVPQARKRLIIVLTRNNFSFDFPKKYSNHITVAQAIGHLPSLESGERSDIKHHAARIHTKEHIELMRHTPTGKSAFQNEVYYPKKEDGTRITGYPYTYKRIDWDRPAPTITMRSDTISSTHTVHPGRPIGNGLYSDARVLTLRELFILSSINPDIDLPEFASHSQIRYMVGEAVPPKLMEAIFMNIKESNA